MCGILAIQGPAEQALLSTLLKRIKHRGPDGDGVWRRGDTQLGHVRLAILDEAGGAQPMTNESGDLAIAFNGEIYNHLALRRELESRHVFASRSDTETLLHLYEDEGEDMLDRLDGMFAVALSGPDGLLLARDPVGIKPLYVGRTGETFIAASELKAFPPMDTIEMLPAGHAMSPGGRPWPFARPFPPRPPIRQPSLEEMLREIRLRLEEAVLKRLMGDVPVGVYLSGGLDSSLVAALMRPHSVKLHSFTAGIKGAPDLAAARQMADFLGTEHHELLYTEADMHRALPEVVGYLESFDAPLVRSALPMFFVSKLAAEHVKVVLSGEGADELFAGYSYLAKLEGRERLRRELDAIVIRLQDINLQRADRMSMAHGLEARVPFLDQRLLRYVSRLPVEWIEPRPDRPEKWLLREACRGLLPDAILNRKKMKFSEGAGSSETIARHLADTMPRAEFERNRMVEGDVALRSPEELFYYRIWREAMPAHIPARLVARTLDATASLPPG